MGGQPSPSDGIDRPEVNGPPPDPPRIYVASLADYNSGRLHGRWIELGPDVEIADVEIEIQDMLATSPESGVVEEYAIHDYEGFGQWQVEEYAPIRHIQLMARKIAEHGQAFTAWVENHGICLYQHDLEDLDDMFDTK